jgi:hypothetical protein
MRIKEMEEILNNLYNVSDVKTGYTFYLMYLMEKCIKIFEWENLPQNEMYDTEIERSLILNGFCGLTKVGDKFLSVNGSEYGVTDYTGIFSSFVWTTPKRNGNFEIGTGGVLLKSNSLKVPLITIIMRYARQLADVDSTIEKTLVNLRTPFLNVANDELTASSIKKTLKAIALGKDEVVVNEEIYKSILQLENSPKQTGNLKELIECKRFILQSFYNDIGVKVASDKKERMIQTEIDSNNQMLLVSLSDMLQCRKKACEQFNELYGTNVSVKLSKEFDVEEVENVDVDTVESVESGVDNNVEKFDI